MLLFDLFSILEPIATGGTESFCYCVFATDIWFATCITVAIPLKIELLLYFTSVQPSGEKAFWFPSLCDLANVSDMSLHSGTEDRNDHFQSDLSNLMESEHGARSLEQSLFATENGQFTYHSRSSAEQDKTGT